MSVDNPIQLSECTIETNCKLVEWEFKNLNESFLKLVSICNKLPRTKVIKSNSNYWHGICRSLIFRFPDDLEILKLNNKGIIQVKSSSRIGLSDLGVNAIRINKIYKILMKT